MISWKLSKEDAALVKQIVNRAVEEELIENDTEVRFALTMDITAVHVNTVQLDLYALLHARLSDFGHDVLGVRNYIDRSTAKLTDCFLPRYAKKERTPEDTDGAEASCASLVDWIDAHPDSLKDACEMTEGGMPEMREFLRIIEDMRRYNKCVYGGFVVISIAREDFKEVGYDASNVDDSTMYKMVSSIGEAINSEGASWCAMGLYAGMNDLPELPGTDEDEDYEEED